MLNLKFLSPAIATLLFFLVSGSGLALAAQYPLKVSVDGRHLEDQAGQPFLINGDTPWSLIVGLTKVEAEQYLEDRRSRGFNSIIVNLIEHKFGGPYNRDGEYPFLSLGDFSQPNEAYFQHADWLINKATEKGFLVILTPAYIGYQCGDAGWCQEMKAATPDELRGYGNFLGNRYKNYDNIIWMHGGDAKAANYDALGHVNAIAEGIRAVDPGKLFTAHGNRWSSAIGDYNEPWLDINNTYSGCELSASNTRTAFQRSPVMPFFYVEGRYEGEGTTDGQCLRSQAYWSVLGGSTGHFFGNNPIWLFNPGWQAALDSPGSRSMTHFGKLFASRPWSLLVPDFAETIVSGNRGAIDKSDYVMVARASDGSVIMAYMPNGRTVTVDMSTVAGSVADVWWYDPEKGNSQYVGEFPTSGSQDFTPLDTSDWVLVIDNADKGFPPLGESGAVPPGQCNDGIDNDADGLTDLADPGCDSAADDDEYNPPPPAAQCDDGVDNDADGLTDLADPGCDSAADDDEYNPPPPAAQCDDGVDNDADGLTDLADPGCDSAADDDEYNPPPPAAQCDDGVDNDADGLTDLADPGCDSAADDDEYNPPPPAAQCDDGVDNDADGLTDLADPGCDSAADDDEYNPPPPPAAQCDDGVDNDADGLTDLADPGCDSAADDDEYNPPPPPAAQCDDGVDNDADGLTDLADPGCDSASDNDEYNSPPSPPPATQCNDGVDNDADGLTDLADPGCDSASDNDEYNSPPSPPPATQCNDGIDNDADGLTDLADPGCDSASDNDEYNSPPSPPPATQCNDGIDNDADGLTDLADPGCDSASDNDEYNSPPSPPPATQCNDGIDNDADSLIDLADPGCSDVSDNDESDGSSQSSITKIDNLSQSNITQPESGSLEPFTLLFLFYAFVALRQRTGVSL